jgi:hypothetical protein
MMAETTGPKRKLPVNALKKPPAKQSAAQMTPAARRNAILRRNAAIKKKNAAIKARAARRLALARSAAASNTRHGPQIVRQAQHHMSEIFARRDSSYFVHLVFTECGLAFTYTAIRYWPPHPWFVRVRNPLPGDIALYAEQMGIYAGQGKMIIAEPGPEKVTVAAVTGFLNFVGYFRWYQDAK